MTVCVLSWRSSSPRPCPLSPLQKYLRELVRQRALADSEVENTCWTATPVLSVVPPVWPPPAPPREVYYIMVPGGQWLPRTRSLTPTLRPRLTATTTVTPTLAPTPVDTYQIPAWVRSMLVPYDRTQPLDPARTLYF